MKVKIIRRPVTLLIIEDFLSPELNELIRLEAKNLPREEAGVGTTPKGIVAKEMRSNQVMFYDTLYEEKREQSILLNAFSEKFCDEEFREILGSMNTPFCDFSRTTTHETQVSVYEKGQKYKWHVDRFDSLQRHLTLVYQFHKEPKRFKGGQICFTTSPVYKGDTIEKVSKWRRNLIKLEPKNNMAIIFDPNVPHQVLPAYSENPEYSRYSVNCWIGFV